MTPVRQSALLDRVTTICLALPEAAADDRHPPDRGFVVNKRNFRRSRSTSMEMASWRSAFASEPRRTKLLLPPTLSGSVYRSTVARHGWVTYYLDVPHRPVDGPKSPNSSATAIASKPRSASLGSSTSDGARSAAFPSALSRVIDLTALACGSAVHRRADLELHAVDVSKEQRPLATEILDLTDVPRQRRRADPSRPRAEPGSRRRSQMVDGTSSALLSTLAHDVALINLEHVEHRAATRS